uniref:SOUL heme-binding protein n=2 Tax=Eucampia antarctica TaxID=49252 RepID=A0A7S2R3G2_9STRA|mmetsp:Transcript_15975/g.15368  ORF Transcript_15975/g.15368 Transcript_15975/m.15368 type:complete len:427 (+) Transcript_15975:56-1336(+)
MADMRRAFLFYVLVFQNANSIVGFAPPARSNNDARNSLGNVKKSFVGYSKINASLNNIDSSSSIVSSDSLKEKVTKLKRVLDREYVTFFAPMQKEYYSSTVTFEDPMTSLSGVDSYQGNVDMLASRTLMGKALFSDAGISLHKITGGDVNEASDGSLSITDIQTRWSLRLTAKVFPWKPTARFTGVSVYKVVPTNDAVGVKIMNQLDYWDSINIRSGSDGVYQKVEKGVAIKDFLNQLKPGGFQAKSAAPELPYQLLRRGDGYEVRKYPSFTGVKLPYRRRDEGFGSLGAFTNGMQPLAPALLEVQDDDTSDKYMMWPLTFTQPGETDPKVPTDATEKAGLGQWRTIKIVTLPERVVAIGGFTDASMGPVVRKADRDLREVLGRDGLIPVKGSEKSVRFAQYDAIFSMGRRRGEVWLDLEDNGHPW